MRILKTHATWLLSLALIPSGRPASAQNVRLGEIPLSLGGPRLVPAMSAPFSLQVVAPMTGAGNFSRPKISLPEMPFVRTPPHPGMPAGSWKERVSGLREEVRGITAEAEVAARSAGLDRLFEFSGQPAASLSGPTPAEGVEAAKAAASRGRRSESSGQTAERIRRDSWDGKGPGRYSFTKVRSLYIEPARASLSLPTLFVNGVAVGYLMGSSAAQARALGNLLDNSRGHAMTFILEGDYGNTTYYISSITRGNGGR